MPRSANRDSVLMELQSVQEGRLERPVRPSAAPSRLFRRLQCEFSDGSGAEESAPVGEGRTSAEEESTAVNEGRTPAEGESTDAKGRSLADSGISSKNSLSTESGFSEEEPA